MLINNPNKNKITINTNIYYNIKNKSLIYFVSRFIKQHITVPKHIGIKMYLISAYT